MSIIHLVSMSGGKDSTATALMALEQHGADSCRFVFADTGNEHELTLEYLDYLEQELDIQIVHLRASFEKEIARKRLYVLEKWPNKGVSPDICERAAKILEKPSGNPYLDLCLWKGRFPSRMAQFCTTELKTIPLTEYAMELIDAGNIVWSWQGIRADESLKRRHALPFEEVGGGLFINRPILQWKAEDTFEAMRAAGIEPNPLYKLGMGRVGCMPCINAKKGELQEISKRFPEHIARIAEWEKLVSEASKRGISSFFRASEGSVLFGQNTINHAVEWSKTTFGGRQFDLLSATEELESCSSSYGLCE